LNSDEKDKVIAEIYDYEVNRSLFKLPDYIPENKPFRWVRLNQNDVGCPCGGTHVQHITDIKGIKIPKIIK
jgi:Ser-tRNA(Ala) deacylase AlaX